MFVLEEIFGTVISEKIMSEVFKIIYKHIRCKICSKIEKWGKNFWLFVKEVIKRLKFKFLIYKNSW